MVKVCWRQEVSQTLQTFGMEEERNTKPLSLLCHGMLQNQDSRLAQDMQAFCSIWFAAKSITRPAAGLGFLAWIMNPCWERRRNSTAWAGWHTLTCYCCRRHLCSPPQKWLLVLWAVVLKATCDGLDMNTWNRVKTTAVYRDLDHFFISCSFSLYLSSLPLRDDGKEYLLVFLWGRFSLCLSESTVKREQDLSWWDRANKTQAKCFVWFLFLPILLLEGNSVGTRLIIQAGCGSSRLLPAANHRGLYERNQELSR